MKQMSYRLPLIRPLGGQITSLFNLVSRGQIQHTIPSTTLYRQPFSTSTHHADAFRNMVQVNNFSRNDGTFHYPRHLLRRKKNRTTALKVLTRDTPPYPFPARHVYKQSNFGLYGLARVRFGNRVAKSEWKTKTRRRWEPNVQRKRLFSEALGTRLEAKMTTRVLRTVDKVGGLDNYLLRSKPRQLRELGPKGWVMRWKVIQSEAIQKKWAEERQELGIASKQSEHERKLLYEQFKKIIESKPKGVKKFELYREKTRRHDILRLKPGSCKQYGKDKIRKATDLIEKGQALIWEATDRCRNYWHDTAVQISSERDVLDSTFGLQVQLEHMVQRLVRKEAEAEKKKLKKQAKLQKLLVDTEIPISLTRQL